MLGCPRQVTGCTLCRVAGPQWEVAVTSERKTAEEARLAREDWDTGKRQIFLDGIKRQSNWHPVPYLHQGLIAQRYQLYMQALAKL